MILKDHSEFKTMHVALNNCQSAALPAMATPVHSTQAQDVSDFAVAQHLQKNIFMFVVPPGPLTNIIFISLICWRTFTWSLTEFICSYNIHSSVTVKKFALICNATVGRAVSS